MNDRHSLLDTILGAFVPIHPDGYKFVAGAALATLILFALAPPLGWLARHRHGVVRLFLPRSRSG